MKIETQHEIPKMQTWLNCFFTNRIHKDYIFKLWVVTLAMFIFDTKIEC